jgi:vacuolar-type H+-ATPase subunit I/STV1
MITPALMELLSLVVLKDKADAVAAELLKLGVFHPVALSQIEDKLKGLNPAQIEKENTAWEALQEKLSEISRRLKVKIAVDSRDDLSGLSYTACDEALSSLEKELEPLSAKRSELQEGLAVDQAMLSQVKEYLPFPFQRDNRYSFLETSVGRIEEKNIALLERSLKGIPHVIYPFQRQNGYTITLIIGLRRDRVLIERVLAEAAWQEVEYPEGSEGLSRAAEEKIKRQLEEARQKLKDLDIQLEQIASSRKQELSRIGSAIAIKRSLLEAKRYSSLTDKTVIFCGWVPQEEKEGFIRRIKAISGISYLESKAPEQLDLAK